LLLVVFVRPDCFVAGTAFRVDSGSATMQSALNNSTRPDFKGETREKHCWKLQGIVEMKSIPCKFQRVEWDQSQSDHKATTCSASGWTSW
jgi:hypothetical protein